MKDSDDTVSSDKQALEDTTAALMKSGSHPALPGVEVVTLDVNDDDFNEKLSEIKEKALGFYEIERGAVVYGEVAGARAAKMLGALSKNLHGSVVLTFTGYAADSRELWDIPEVITFCRGMLLGSSRKPDLAHSKAVLAVLMDESPYLDVEANTAEEMFTHAAGGMWLVRVAFTECWFSQGGEQLLDSRLNLTLYNWLRGQGTPPTR